MELKDLLGKHLLSGVDISNEKIKSEYHEEFEISQCISFCLDGDIYTAIEDPNDGYRSSMKEIKKSNHILKNTFEPQEVVATFKPDEGTEEHDSLMFIDTTTGLIVLEVGTYNTNDFYPYFVASFTPENMSINQDS